MARGTGVCAASGKSFALGEAYVATLVERAGESGLSRMDFSKEAWDAGARPGDGARVFASWRSVHSHEQPAKKALMSDDELLDLFEELSEATEAKRLSFRYLLALLLVRRKVLKLLGEKRAGERSVMMVRPRRAAEDSPAIEVVDPGMTDGAVADAIEQLGQVVGG